MLKWKTFKLATVSQGDETLVDALAGMSGKNRVIRAIAFDRNADVYVRVYKDAEQIIDLESTLITQYAPILVMDLPLIEGELCKIGFYNKAGTATTPDIAIAYDESS